MTHDTDETFTRTSPPLNRFVAKLPLKPAVPLPWGVLTAQVALMIAQDIEGSGWVLWAEILREYADAVDAMSKKE